eukprot:CAMPEP_0119382154 /NCGR_PEP_ID=MMETSP1334-20130426/70151_1 /TAXON_ID=127549 /ORGANISM="Calcidiscus leptoporus, Strain RCC1130" /LENGTH=55 /DNA_ID=CAMNT_0007402513 /DNA_START=315 /DNA_END=479 /DNA_ORIENTATION=+
MEQSPVDVAGVHVVSLSDDERIFVSKASATVVLVACAAEKTNAVVPVLATPSPTS